MEIKPFPHNEEMNGLYESVPRDGMEYMAYSGLFRQDFPFGGGTASMTAYLPQRLPHDCYAVLALVPGGDDPAAFLARTGWLELADRNKLLILALGLEQGGDPLALAQKARDVLMDRKYYNLGKSRVYVAAYGAAAPVGQQLILTSPDKLAGLALAGGEGCSAAELEALGNAPSAVPYIPMRDVPCPVCIFTQEMTKANQAAVDFFIGVNHLEPRPYLRDGVSYYLPDRVWDDNWVQSENTAPVAVLADPGLDLAGPAATARIWSELRKYFRALDYVNTSTHPCRTKAQWGTARRETVIDGWLRTWEEFVPAAALRGDRKCPLVVDLHGGSGNPDIELSQGCWVRTAKARDLFLAVPHGSLRRFSNGTMPHPAWNASGASADQDDFKLIRHIVEDMLRRYPQIDRTRVYITGHSMGSAMTQQVILRMPELFAAAASNGGVIRGGFFGEIRAPEDKEHFRMPVIVQMGQFDRGGGTFEENADAKRTVAYWIGRNRAGDVERPGEYVNGPFHHKVYHNADGIPMVHYITTENKPHVVTSQDALMYYDEFLSKFSRLEDGTTCYMGRPVR